MEDNKLGGYILDINKKIIAGAINSQCGSSAFLIQHAQGLKAITGVSKSCRVYIHFIKTLYILYGVF